MSKPKIHKCNNCNEVFTLESDSKHCPSCFSVYIDAEYSLKEGNDHEIEVDEHTGLDIIKD